MELGRRARGRVRDGQQRGCAERLDERVFVLRVDEHAGFPRNELGRAAHTRRDDAPRAGERLERGLAERLDEARLAEDVGGREVLGHGVVRHVAGHRHARPPFEP